MTNFSLRSRVATWLIILLLPLTAFAQASPFQQRFDDAALFCSTSSETECVNLVLAILADLQRLTAGEQYDFELASFVVALVGVLDENSSSAMFDVISEAITQVAQSATDPDQAAQLLLIAELVDSEEIVVIGSDLVVASPS